MPLFTREDKLQSEYQKWDYITLSDFQLRSWGAVLSYAWLWCLAIIAVAVYAADTFTAVNLLVFDRWSSQIDPTIPFSISKWIFAACILFSWVLCAYEWVRAIRVIRRRNVAESYLDPLAATLQSIRLDKNGRGWRRFLVFAELTKSKKGADYLALFCYFQFKGAVRLLLAEGPRQVVNGLTLYGVMQAKLFAVGQNAPSDGNSSFVQFFLNVQILANQHTEQAIILFSMLFTFVIWAISALSFLTACILYGGFLWHYLPSTDRTLPRYCRRKIDKRLSRIVNFKFKAAMRKQDALRRQEQEMFNDDDDRVVFPKPARRPTLPTLPDKSPLLLETNKQLPHVIVEPMPPPYSYQPTVQDRLIAQGSALVPFRTDIRRPGFPSRTGTQSTNHSTTSLESDSHLLSQAATMGTSATIRDRNDIGSHDTYVEHYSPYDIEAQDIPPREQDAYDNDFRDAHNIDYSIAGLEQMEEGRQRTMVETTRGFPARDQSFQQDKSHNRIISKPIRSDSAPEAYSSLDRAAVPTLKPPGTIKTGTPGNFGGPRQNYNVRFGATTQIPPTPNFSLPHRTHTYPDPAMHRRPAEKAVSDPKQIKVQKYEMQAPQVPSSTFQTGSPSEPQPLSDRPSQMRYAPPEYQVRIVQAPPQPRRNMTMPLDEPERFAPPRRVRTVPMPPRSKENHPSWNDHGREQGYGDRGSIPAIRGMAAQAPRPECDGTGRTVRKVYRFS